MTVNDLQRQAAVARWGDMVWRLALAGAKHTQDAEDVFQDVFERYFRHEDRLSTDEHRKVWLIRCTVNRCKSLFSSPWRRRRVSLDSIAELGVPEESREVYLAVRALPAKYALVIHLHYYEGYSVAQIAGQLGCAEGTVKSQLSRARAMLRHSLSEEVTL